MRPDYTNYRQFSAWKRVVEVVRIGAYRKYANPLGLDPAIFRDHGVSPAIKTSENVEWCGKQRPAQDSLVANSFT